MPTTTFEYSISGVELNEAQKSAINAAIASAVTHTLLGGPGQSGQLGDLAKGKVWGAIGGGIGPINGGRLIFAATQAKLKETLAQAIHG